MTSKRCPFVIKAKIGMGIATNRYAAGLFDGEGYISITKTRSGYGLSCGLTNTDPRLTEWMYNAFGGGVHLTEASGNRRAVFFWNLNGLDAHRFLCLLSSCFIGKCDHIDIVKSIPVRVGRLLISKSHYLQMKDLNRRKHLPDTNLNRWVHLGQHGADHRRLALVTLARKLCPVCAGTFGLRRGESLREFWRRLYCSHKCGMMGRNPYLSRERIRNVRTQKAMYGS